MVGGWKEVLSPLFWIVSECMDVPRRDFDLFRAPFVTSWGVCGPVVLQSFLPFTNVSL